MIPFASQRGGGQDLATHLMNAHDNDQVDLCSVRGAVARDLHGAFAEWEAIAEALTRCRQHLCSLSINPDERQGRLTRDQYLDYIARAEAALGLTGQPRAIIFHIKRDGHGRAREHCHVVWSRIDVQNKRAVPLSFLKEKMMAVTREFARDHVLALPPGYNRQEAEQRRNRQLSSYDCIKQKQTGITHEGRMAAVTDAWRRGDSGRAFVQALADLGYILAQGRNRARVVLVDVYGHTTALTRLIDDPAVRARHVRDFLGPDYAPGKLPTVERAQEVAAQRRKLIEAFEIARTEEDEAEALVRQQEARRHALGSEAAALRQRQHEERIQLAAAHKSARQELTSAYLAEQRRVRLERGRRRPKGLAAFLGRVTGVALITRKAQRYRDSKRYGAYLALRAALSRRQQHERDALARRHELQAADLRRRLRALDQIEKREHQTSETAALRARRQAINARHAHMPSLVPALARCDGAGVRRNRAGRAPARRWRRNSLMLPRSRTLTAASGLRRRSSAYQAAAKTTAARSAALMRPRPPPMKQFAVAANGAEEAKS
jgi:MobA/VirD2-like, nuclease domain